MTKCSKQAACGNGVERGCRTEHNNGVRRGVRADHDGGEENDIELA